MGRAGAVDAAAAGPRLRPHEPAPVDELRGDEVVEVGVGRRVLGLVPQELHPGRGLVLLGREEGAHVSHDAGLLVLGGVAVGRRREPG